MFSAEARQYVSGITWHGYEGPYETPALFHEKYPDIGTTLYKWSRKCNITSLVI